MFRKKISNSFSDLLWDLWCIVSVVGIWPRFIEHKLLEVRHLEFKLLSLQKELKLAVFSDLHFHNFMNDNFLNKLSKNILDFRPDVILFLGDFICDGELVAPEKLKSFLKQFDPSHGAFAILGNHDYATPVSINDKGDYAVSDKGSPFIKAFKRLFCRVKVTGHLDEEVRQIPEQKELLALLSETPFKVLNNETVQVEGVNLVGLGEYMLGRAFPEKAFQNYDKTLPGVILAHNPDMIPHLKNFPGQIILSGHTHGGQINLPWIWRKLSMMEHDRFKSGLIQEGDKQVYVTRGVGSTKPFRWRARPELVKMTLKPEIL